MNKKYDNNNIISSRHISNIMEASRGEINQGVEGAGYTTKIQGAGTLPLTPSFLSRAYFR
jgi:hypothetical protein